MAGIFCNGPTQRPATDFYPASGWRYSHNAGLTNVGIANCSWSSAPLTASNFYGSSIYFNNGNISPEVSNGSNRANGFPVRCVAE